MFPSCARRGGKRSICRGQNDRTMFPFNNNRWMASQPMRILYPSPRSFPERLARSAAGPVELGVKVSQKA
jgi:hypothetical protein